MKISLDEAGPARPLLCRLLAERDPHCDPHYALQHFYGEMDGPVHRWLGHEVYRSPWGGSMASPGCATHVRSSASRRT